MRGSSDFLYIGQQSVAILPPPFTTPFQEEGCERKASFLVHDPVVEEGSDQEKESSVVTRKKKEIKQDNEMQSLVTAKKEKDQKNETDFVWQQPTTDHCPQPRHTETVTELSSNPTLPNNLKKSDMFIDINADHVRAPYSPGKPFSRKTMPFTKDKGHGSLIYAEVCYK